jgi:hypothetical protein
MLQSREIAAKAIRAHGCQKRAWQLRFAPR